MKKLLLFSLFIISSLSIHAQENGLYYDNIDDNTSTANASSLIAGSNEISLTMWVYPENTFPSFPDYDGFGGFRNNTDADFYLLQLTATDVEARFRNSAGTPFDIVFTGLVLNAWNHFVLTYDGTTLTLYHDGMAAGSVPATGNIANATESFYTGLTPWTGSPFYLNGKLDEVSLWSKSLTSTEINCLMTGAIDPAAANLELYYRFNQGVASGNNASVNTLMNAASATMNGVLNGFALNGATSNWYAGVLTANASTISAFLCPGSIYPFGGQNLTTAGTYYASFPSTLSTCDSVVQLNLSTATINTNVSQVGPSLTAIQTGAVYQWINCPANTPIAGATNQNYVATANGQYAVIITLGGCADTSVCITVTNVGLNELNAMGISASPNPFNESITLQIPANYSGKQIVVFDVTGREVYRMLCNSSQLVISTALWNASVYFISIEGVASRLKLVKQ